MKNILIRTLGGGSIGYGHFFRCLSLSKALIKNKKNINITFLINNDLVELIKSEGFNYLVSNSLKNDESIIFSLQIDLFVLDTYLADDSYLKMVKNKTRLMLIDDNNDIYDSTLVDIIYNGNIHAEKLNYPFVEVQTRLLGTKYLIMKEEYWCNEDKDIMYKEGILITTGGSDEHRIAIDIIKEIKDLGVKIKVIIGPGYTKDYIKEIECERSENIELIYSPTSLKEYIRQAKIVITAGGSTVYEVLSQKSMPIIFSLADNQDLICIELRSRDIPYLGKYPNIDYSRTKVMVKKLFENKLIFSNIFRDVDGEGALRLIEDLYRLLNEKYNNE